MPRPTQHYTHPAVLVIDEVGYLTVGGAAANLMSQVVNERYQHRRPMLFTINKPRAAWGLVLHNPDLAEASWIARSSAGAWSSYAARRIVPGTSTVLDQTGAPAAKGP